MKKAIVDVGPFVCLGAVAVAGGGVGGGAPSLPGCPQRSLGQRGGPVRLRRGPDGRGGPHHFAPGGTLTQAMFVTILGKQDGGG